MKRDELFPSKWLKASDLADGPAVVTIARVEFATVKNDGADQDKPVLVFREKIKSLICNLTNYDAIAELHGEETDTWIGKQIELYATKTRMGGKQVDCVRARRVSEPDLDLEKPAPKSGKRITKIAKIPPKSPDFDVGDELPEVP